MYRTIIPDDGIIETVEKVPISDDGIGRNLSKIRTTYFRGILYDKKEFFIEINLDLNRMNCRTGLCSYYTNIIINGIDHAALVKGNIISFNSKYYKYHMNVVNAENIIIGYRIYIIHQIRSFQDIKILLLSLLQFLFPFYFHPSFFILQNTETV